jgi:hypothetical protein
MNSEVKKKRERSMSSFDSSEVSSEEEKDKSPVISMTNKSKLEFEDRKKRNKRRPT